MPMMMPNSFQTSSSGSVITPAPCRLWLINPWRRSRVTQAKARTSTEIHSGTSTQSSHQRRARSLARVIV